MAFSLDKGNSIDKASLSRKKSVCVVTFFNLFSLGYTMGSSRQGRLSTSRCATHKENDFLSFDLGHLDRFWCGSFGSGRDYFWVGILHKFV